GAEICPAHQAELVTDKRVTDFMYWHLRGSCNDDDDTSALCPDFSLPGLVAGQISAFRQPLHDSIEKLACARCALMVDQRHQDIAPATRAKHIPGEGARITQSARLQMCHPFHFFGAHAAPQSAVDSGNGQRRHEL